MAVAEAKRSDSTDGGTDEGIFERGWTREEFNYASELGLFAPEERLELIGGKIYRKMTQKASHAMALLQTAYLLQTTFGTGFHVRTQLPIILFTDGQPEPDIVVVPGNFKQYTEHPTESNVLLIVEISDATLHFDRGRKAALYAEARIAEYWILNLNERQLEVLRQPAADQTARYDYAYQSRQILSETDTISPLAASSAPILVSDMLPV
jgi:Uma2 family endonuclease